MGAAAGHFATPSSPAAARAARHVPKSARATRRSVPWACAASGRPAAARRRSSSITPSAVQLPSRTRSRDRRTSFGARFGRDLPMRQPYLLPALRVKNYLGLQAPVPGTRDHGFHPWDPARVDRQRNSGTGSQGWHEKTWDPAPEHWHAPCSARHDMSDPSGTEQSTTAVRCIARMSAVNSAGPEAGLAPLRRSGVLCSESSRSRTDVGPEGRPRSARRTGEVER